MGWVVLACLMLLVTSIGCGPNRDMGRKNIQVTLDRSLGEGGSMPSIDVDLVGVKPAERASWDQSDKISQYWQAQSQLRADLSPLAYRMEFKDLSNPTATLSKGNKIWNKWGAEGIKELILLVNMPGAGAESRRAFIPLETYRWKSKDDIKVRILRTGPRIETPMNPEKQ
jgi:hypothetical protein